MQLRVQGFVFVSLWCIGFFSGTEARSQMEDVLRLEVATAKTKHPVVKFTSVGPGLLKVMVRDELRQPVPGLQKENFTIHRGKVKGEILSVKENVEVKELARRVVLLIDNSGSMRPSRDDVVNDLDSLIASFGRNTSVAVLLFAEGATGLGTRSLFEYKGTPLKLKGKWFTTNKGELMRYLRSEFFEASLTSRTYLFDEVYAGYQILESSRERNSDDLAIVLSDGEDNASETTPEVIRRLSWGSTPFYTIDYLRGESNEFLVSLAQTSGGKYFRAGSISDLRKIFKTISEQIVSGGYEVKYRLREPPRGTLTFYAASLDINDTSRVGTRVDTLTVEEQIVRQQFPLLTYIFFDQGKADIPPRYSALHSPAEIESFDESRIPGGAIEHYYHVLDIIGSRLRANPQTTITLVGCSDGTPVENAIQGLSKRRAETVRDYFVSIWGISEKRIRLETRGLPENPSAISLKEGQEENRRVEILSSDWEIMKPVAFESREYQSTPSAAIFQIHFQLEEALRLWSLAVYSEGRMWKEFTGTTEHNAEIRWDWRNDNGDLPRSSLRYQCTAEDLSGLAGTIATATIPVRFLSLERKQVEHLADKDIEKISLILFDFNSAVLGSKNEKILQLVYSRVLPKSSLLVIGSTDVIGDEKANLILSQRRAQAVYEQLVASLGHSTPIRTVGYGESLAPFTNSLPEGRFYNRTVQVVIETPHEQR
ncbi:MAG: OmpA family protein [Bacteroidota bacterium]